jgi:hypothetical protein
LGNLEISRINRLEARRKLSGGETPAESFRVSVVVEAAVVPAWIAALVTRLRASPGATVTTFRSGPTAPEDRSSRLYRLYERVDERLFRRDPDALEVTPLPGPDPRPLDELEACDVVLNFASVDSARLAPLARSGAWVLVHTDREGRPQEPPLFWETYRREIYGMRLEAQLPDGDCRILYSSFGATDRGSLARGRNRAYWKAHAAIVSRVEAVAERGPQYLRSRPKGVAQYRGRANRPRATTVARHAVRVAWGVVGRRVKAMVYSDDWFVAARPASPERASPFVMEGRPFLSITPPGSLFADPFLLEHERGTYVFIEDVDRAAGKAVISYVRVDDRGTPIEQPARALERDYHLSYPFVFRHEGEIFMVPETADNRTVELYRAVDFPSRWELEHILLRDIFAGDATLLEGSERLWLFVCVAEPGAPVTDELHLYSAATLTGPWTPHPENPVVSDVRSARPAGRIFRHGDHLIRPAQDCSLAYGFAIVFNRIDVLTPSEYRETPVGRIDPTWSRGLSATHTYNFTETLEVIDGRRSALRPRYARITRRRGRR